MLWQSENTCLICSFRLCEPVHKNVVQMYIVPGMHIAVGVLGNQQTNRHFICSLVYFLFICLFACSHMGEEGILLAVT